jgi:hypothetical protein
MSSITLSTITSQLATLFEDELVAQWNRAVVLSKLLPVKPGISQNINWDVKATDGSVAYTSANITEGGTVSTFSDDALSVATLSFTNYYDAFGISGLALNAARVTGNPAALADLFGEKLMDCVTRLAKNLNQSWYLGTGASNVIAGLVDPTNGALKASGTYAGINKGSVTLFQGNELTNGGSARPLSFQIMRDTIRTIYTNSGETPDLIIADPIQFARYGMLFGEQRRYMTEMTTAGGNYKLDGGFKALEFDGIPFVQDKDANAGQALFLNTKHVVIRQMPDYLADAGEVGAVGRAAMMKLSGTPETQLGAGTTSLTARLLPLAVVGDNYTFQLIVYPQLQVRRPNACAMLGDLVEA